MFARRVASCPPFQVAGQVNRHARVRTDHIVPFAVPGRWHIRLGAGSDIQRPTSAKRLRLPPLTYDVACWPLPGGFPAWIPVSRQPPPGRRDRGAQFRLRREQRAGPVLAVVTGPIGGLLPRVFPARGHARQAGCSASRVSCPPMTTAGARRAARGRSARTARSAAGLAGGASCLPEVGDYMAGASRATLKPPHRHWPRREQLPRLAVRRGAAGLASSSFTSVKEGPRRVAEWRPG